MGDVKPLIPPLRFAAVSGDVYRGSYPRPVNFRFLKRHGLKTIVSLIPEEITPTTDRQLYEFAIKDKIKLVHVEVQKGGKGKKRQVPLTHSVVDNVISIVMDPQNWPVYIHCLNGGHVTSLVVACLRKTMQWTNASVFSEFLLYSEAVNVADRVFVEEFKANTCGG